jgi:1,4-dihydroxy-2-naphthoate octaprenyltransferase
MDTNKPQHQPQPKPQIQPSKAPPKQPPISKLQAWLLATRPKTLTASIIPVIAGTALASAVILDINWKIAFCALVSAILIQIGTNFINDALDFKKGADTHTRKGPMRASQSGLLPMKHVYYAGLGSLALAFLFGIPLMVKGGPPIAILLLVSLACAYLYTGGPFPLAYHGLGDLFVLLFFGIASVAAVYFLQTQVVDGRALLAGAQIGMLATVLIAINNLRDHEEDAKVNKCTLAVRFGITFSRYEIAFLAFMPFLLNMIWFKYGFVVAGALPWLTAPLAIRVVSYIWQMEPGPIYNRYLAQAALLHLLFGIALTLGFMLS